MRRRVYQPSGYGMLLGAALMLLSACGRRYWTPSAEQRQIAQELAKLAVLQHLSDQASEPQVQALRYRSGEAIETPVLFTIQDVPFSRYRSKLWGARHAGKRVVIVEYFDPTRLPDWESDQASGAYPVHIVVAVDPDAGQVELPVPFDLRVLKR